jgi:hypothetical protein
LLSHFKFVKNHHRHIAKVAAVIDSGFLSIYRASQAILSMPKCATLILATSKAPWRGCKANAK